MLTWKDGVVTIGWLVLFHAMGGYRVGSFPPGGSRCHLLLGAACVDIVGNALGHMTKTA